jgi:ABC-2 type transport system ATP-binding protein
MDDAIALHNVRKTFGDKVAVEGMDLRIARGSLTGFIGPNGAGKTTTIRMIMSIIFPDSGTLEVLGRKSAVESKDRIGYLPEERGVYKKMKVGAFLEHMARLKGVRGPDVRRRVQDWLARVDLGDVHSKKCEELSKGMQQKVQFIASVIHEPELIILDEPFSGLDPVNMRMLRDLILEQHRAGRTVIFSTHVMHTAESLCDHIVMICRGKKVLDAPLAEIQREHQARAIEFIPLDAGADLSVLQRLPGVAGVREADRGGVVEVRDGVDVADMLGRVASAMPMSRVQIQKPSLEDLFIEIVEKSGEGDIDELRAAVRGTSGLAAAGVGGEGGALEGDA